MRVTRIILAIALLTFTRFAIAAGPGIETTQESLSTATDTVVLQLGDPDPAVREHSQAQLHDLGVQARPALLRGMRQLSPEIADRSWDILRELPWDVSADPPAVRLLLRNYGDRDTNGRMQTVRQLFALPDRAGYAALARLIVEDRHAQVQWKIAQTFREGSARLSPAQVNQLTLAGDIPAALCLAGWSCQQNDFPTAIELYRSAIRIAFEKDEPCLEGLSPAFDTLVGLHLFKREYDAAADLLRTEWAMSLRECDAGEPDFRVLDRLLAIHAINGSLGAFTKDVMANPDSLTRSPTYYSLGKMLESEGRWALARGLYELAYLRGLGSPQAREIAGEFLLEQNWTTLAERELRAITHSWFAYGATVDTARMRLGLLHSNLGDDQLAAQYLAKALPALHRQSVWLSIQVGDKHYYGRGAEKHLWAMQHLHAMRYALSQHNDDVAQKEALALAELSPTDPTFALAAVPVLKSGDHVGEAKRLFETAYAAAKDEIDQEGENALRLNNIAWLCAVCTERLDDGLTYARRAVSLAMTDANILDTLAELHFARKEFNDAIEQERRAVKLEPANDYLQKRLSRFEKSR